MDRAALIVRMTKRGKRKKLFMKWRFVFVQEANGEALGSYEHLLGQVGQLSDLMSESRETRQYCG